MYAFLKTLSGTLKNCAVQSLYVLPLKKECKQYQTLVSEIHAEVLTEMY